MGKDNSNFFAKKSQWANIKDRLLGAYLTVYFQKLLKSNRPICYFDCFAGKGKFEDGSDGSPLVALKTRDERLLKTTAGNSLIKSFFLDYEYSDELRENVKFFNRYHADVQVDKGKFEEKVYPFLQTLPQNINVFLYIDPYGIKALKSNLLDSFSDLNFASFEMLINFNSFGLFRNACKVKNVSYAGDEALAETDDIAEYEPTEFTADFKSEKLLNDISGGNYWKQIVDAYRKKEINGYQAERQLALGYKKRLREKYEFVLDMPIRLRPGLLPKYRMIHVTNHKDGCYTMAENMMNRSDELYMDTAIETCVHKQLSLFDLNHDVENELVDPETVKEKVISCLRNQNDFIGCVHLIAIFYTEYGIICKIGVIKKILKELEEKRMITVRRKHSITDKGQLSRSFTEGPRQKVEIKLGI